MDNINENCLFMDTKMFTIILESIFFENGLLSDRMKILIAVRDHTMDSELCLTVIERNQGNKRRTMYKRQKGGTSTRNHERKGQLKSMH
jgi:hypothetical protein